MVEVTKENVVNSTSLNSVDPDTSIGSRVVVVNATGVTDSTGECLIRSEGRTLREMTLLALNLALLFFVTTRNGRETSEVVEDEGFTLLVEVSATGRMSLLAFLRIVTFNRFNCFVGEIEAVVRSGKYSVDSVRVGVVSTENELSN